MKSTNYTDRLEYICDYCGRPMSRVWINENGKDSCTYCTGMSPFKTGITPRRQIRGASTINIHTVYVLATTRIPDAGREFAMIVKQTETLLGRSLYFYEENDLLQAWIKENYHETA